MHAANRKQVKNSGEYPITCTPILFRGFSEKAKRRVLEAAMDPEDRTLGPIDACLEDGVIFLTTAKVAKEKEEQTVRSAPGGTPSAAQSQEQDSKEEAGREGEVKEVAPAPDSVLAPITPRKLAPKVDYDIPPAPMPPPVDRSIFEDFNPVLPPEPDTPFDDKEDPTSPPPPQQEEHQADKLDQPPSPSALRSLFELSDDKQSTIDIVAPPAEEPPAPIANSGEVEAPVPKVNPLQFSPGPDQCAPVVIEDNGRSMVSQGVQTDEVQNEGRVSLPDAVSGLGVVEDLEREAGSDEAEQSASILAPVSSVLVPDPEAVHQGSSTAADLQPRSETDAGLWSVTYAISIILILQSISALAAGTVPNVLPTVSGARAQNDIPAAAPSQLQTPESDQTTLDVVFLGSQEGRTNDGPDASSSRAHAQPQPSTEEESNPTILQVPHLSPQQDPVVDSEASPVGAQAPDNVTAAVASASSNSEEGEAVALTQPTLNDPSTPSGSRRPRPKFTPPSAESQQRPTKRVRGDIIPDVEGDIEAIAPADGQMPQNLPAHPPNSSSTSLGQDQQAANFTNQDERDQVNQGPTAFASIGQTPPESRPAALEQTQSPESDVDTSMESATGPDPHGKGKGRALSPRNGL
ncbi:hypothetical protein FRC01_010179, partial [Tulasnella sp. 417]